MYLLYALFLCTSIVSIIFVALRRSSNDAKNSNLIKQYEENRPTYNQFKVLPFEVKPLEVQHSTLGKLRLILTPTHFQQTDEFLFSIPIKAKYDKGEIGFELVINALPIREEDERYKDEKGLSGFTLNTNSVLADNFLKVLAHLFEVEISNKTQIVKELFLFSEEEKISAESLHEGHEFILFFGDKKPSDTTPAIRLTANLNEGKIIIEEIDPIFRPIIIDRLTFKPNIKT